MQSPEQLMPGKSNANLRGHNSVKYLTNVRLAITRQQEQHLKSLHTKHRRKEGRHIWMQNRRASDSRQI